MSKRKSQKRAYRTIGAMMVSREMDLARKIKPVLDEAYSDLGKNLGGHSALDLVADQFPEESLDRLRTALLLQALYL